MAFAFTILLARQAVEESSKKSLVNSEFPGFIVDCLYALLSDPSRIKFSGGDASCDGTGEPRHFQKRFQNQKIQKRIQKRIQKNQKRTSRPCSSKRSYPTTKRWRERKKEETKKEETKKGGRRWAGRKKEETRWEEREREEKEETRWAEREREEKEGPRLTRGGKCKEG